MGWFILFSIVALVATYFGLRGILWVYLKGPPVAKFIISIALTGFALLMAKVNFMYDNSSLGWLFVFSSVIYAIFGMYSFNLLFPTKKEESNDEQV